MILDTFTAHTPHDAARVFAHWSDPAGWPEWDPEVRAVSFTGPAKIGATGRMRPTSGPAAAFVVTAFEPDRVFTNASSLPGATLIVEHRVPPAAHGAEVEVTVGLDGALAPLWKRLLRANLGYAAHAGAEGLLAHLGAE